MATSLADRAKRIQLFQTVSDLHAAGKISLSRQDKSRIEAETRDLIEKSLRNRSAAKAPEGFEMVLDELRAAPDADAAYEVVVSFLKEHDLLEGEKDEGGEKPKKAPPSEKGETKEPEEGESEEHEKSESPEEEKAEHEPPKGIEDEADKAKDKKPPFGKDEDKGGKPPFGGKGPDKGGKPPFMSGKPEMPKGGPADMPEGKEAPPFGDKDEMKEARSAVLRRAKEQEEKKGIGGLQETREKVKTPSSEEMGIEEASDMTMGMEQGVRAKKISVRITPGRNLVVAHADHGPIFYAQPSPEYRRDLMVLQRLANKIYGIAVYQGLKAAAAYCKADLLKTAGVDDDITTVNRDKDIPPETKGVTEDAEDVSVQERKDKPGTSQDDVDTVTQEKPDDSAKNVKTDVIAKRRAEALKKARARFLAKQKQGLTVLDGNDTVTQEKPDKAENDSGKGAADVAEEDPKAKPGSVIDDQADVIRTEASANLSVLYKNRAAQRVAAEKEAFVRRFVRAARIAATRMLLNHDEHPIKSAAMDVLTSENVVFSNGEKFASMDESTAVELIELIASEGHTAFINRLLEKAADLLEKDDRYLTDVEADLKSLAPVPVSVGPAVARSAGSPRQQRSASVRREAAEGNFSTKGNGAPASSPNNNGGLREALGGSTLLGRRIGRIQG